MEIICKTNNICYSIVFLKNFRSCCRARTSLFQIVSLPKFCNDLSVTMTKGNTKQITNRSSCGKGEIP